MVDETQKLKDQLAGARGIHKAMNTEIQELKRKLAKINQWSGSVTPDCKEGYLRGVLKDIYSLSKTKSNGEKK